MPSKLSRTRTSPPARLASPQALAAGCLAGTALAVAGTWLRFALEGTPRLDTHTWPFVVASAVSGAGLVVSGACSLRLAPRAAAVPWRTLWAWALATHGLAATALALTSSDIFANLAFGALQRAGLSPYRHSPSALAGSPLTPLVPQRWVHDPSPYGPLFHPFVAAAAWAGEALGAPRGGAVYAYKAILVAAVLAALGIAARTLQATQPGAARETWVALALGPLVAWEVSAQGHNEGLVLLAMVAFVGAASVGAASASRQALAAAALACGVAVKYALAPLLALDLLLVARRSAARALLLALLAAAVLAAAFAPAWGSATLRSVLPMMGGEAARHAHSFTDLACLVLEAAGWDRASRMAYRALSAASAVVCAAVLARTAWRARTLPELLHGYLLFLFALYLTAPWFQPWYACWSLPLLLAEPDPRWRRFAAVFAVVTVAQWALPLDPVSTVAGNAWAAVRLWQLRRPPGPDSAGPAA